MIRVMQCWQIRNIHGVAELIVNRILTDSEVSSQVAMLTTHTSDFRKRNTESGYRLFLR